MTVYYTDVRALIDPEQSEPLPAGGRSQDVSVILTDDPRDRRLEPAACTLTPDQARALAFELLVLAEHAERIASRP